MRFKIQDHKLRKAESGTREVNYRGLKMNGGHNAFHLPPSACDLLLLALPLLLAAFCVSPFAFCSQMRGTGTVNACAGGPPRYCADTSMRIMGESAIMYPQIDLNDGGPAVGVPFIDPDTGTRITRITDGSLEIPSGRTNNNFQTNSAAEEYSCSIFNPNLAQIDGGIDIGKQGGYVCKFYDGTANLWMAAIDAQTMQTEILNPPSFVSNNYNWILDGGFSWTDPWVIWGSQAGKFVYYCFQGNPANDPVCAGSGDTIKTLFTINSANCPNLPAGYTGGTLTETQTSKDDNVIGGWAQNEYYIVYNRQTGACNWYDSFYGTTGGTGIAGVQSTSPWGVVEPPASAPTLTPSTTAGSLAPGTYCFEETLEVSNVVPDSETLPGAPACTTLSSTGEIAVARPTLATDQPTKAAFTSTTPYGWDLYACQESSPPTPCTNFTKQNASMISWSTTTTTVTSLAAGVAAPTQSRAGFSIHQARLAMDGQHVLMTANSNNAFTVGFMIWNVGTTTANINSASGHMVAGYHNVLLDHNYYSAIELLSVPFSNVPSSGTWLKGDPANYSTTNDSHPAWTDDNASDTYPACAAMAPVSYSIQKWGKYGYASPNGSWMRYPQTGFNPAFNVAIPYANEIFCWATDGSGTVWRFTHSRSVGGYSGNFSSAALGTWYAQEVLGNMTPDGKFMIFTSLWEWQLGSAGLFGWQPNKSYALNAKVMDSNGNVEKATVGGTSGSARPPWNPVVNGTTTDGTVTWTNLGQCATLGGCRNDVFVVQLK
jgi:hypothetical protein